MPLSDITAEISDILNMDLDTVATYSKKWVWREQQAIMHSGFEWWFLDKEASFNTADGQADYSLNTIAPRFKRAPALSLVYNNIRVPLTAGVITDLRRRYTTTTESRPEMFGLDPSSGAPGNLVLFPTPDDAYAMILQYREALEQLTDPEDTNYLSENWPDILIYGGAARGFAYLKDWANAKEVMNLQNIEFANLVDAHWGYVRSGKPVAKVNTDAGYTANTLNMRE